MEPNRLPPSKNMRKHLANLFARRPPNAITLWTVHLPRHSVSSRVMADFGWRMLGYVGSSGNGKDVGTCGRYPTWGLVVLGNDFKLPLFFPIAKLPGSAEDAQALSCVQTTNSHNPRVATWSRFPPQREARWCLATKPPQKRCREFTRSYRPTAPNRLFAAKETKYTPLLRLLYLSLSVCELVRGYSARVPGRDV